MKKGYCIVFVTCRSKKEALGIASLLLGRRLAACANVMPSVESRFWWGGKLDNARETLLTLKTKTRNFKKIEKEVKRLHSYEVPEIIAVPIIAGSRDYLGWIDNSVKK